MIKVTDYPKGEVKLETLKYLNPLNKYDRDYSIKRQEDLILQREQAKLLRLEYWRNSGLRFVNKVFSCKNINSCYNKEIKT